MSAGGLRINFQNPQKIVRKLREAVLKIAQEKNLTITSGLNGRLQDWDRDLERGGINIEEAIGKIRNERELGNNLSNDDYRKIQDAIK